MTGIWSALPFQGVLTMNDYKDRWNAARVEVEDGVAWYHAESAGKTQR